MCHLISVRKLWCIHFPIKAQSDWFIAKGKFHLIIAFYVLQDRVDVITKKLLLSYQHDNVSIFPNSITQHYFSYTLNVLKKETRFVCESNYTKTIVYNVLTFMSNSMTSTTLSCSMAWCRAVCPLVPSPLLTSAPALIRDEAHSSFPVWTALCRGVKPGKDES